MRPRADRQRFYEIKRILREHKLHTVCEEASCPNIGECFGKGTATFMIMGDICTRRCPFCDVGARPARSARRRTSRATSRETIAALKLRYVVITSVDRDDLRDGGAGISSTASARCASIRPRRGSKCWCRTSAAGSTARCEILDAAPPDVMNHNLETVPRLYRQARPGLGLRAFAALLQDFKRRVPGRARPSPG